MKRSTTAWLHGRKYEDVFTRDDDRDVPPGPDLSGVVYRLPLHLHVHLHLPFSTLLPENFARTLYFSARSTPEELEEGRLNRTQPPSYEIISYSFLSLSLRFSIFVF